MMQRKRFFITFLILFLLLLLQYDSNATNTTATPSKERPEQWATPIQKPGISNFYKVSENLYRGAQPDKTGFEELKKMGIKSVINFRNSHDDAIFLINTGIKYYRFPMIAFFPSKKKFKRYLEIVSDPANLPAFVHCKHGADRTGVAVALYRIKIQGWSTNDAINEMVNGGYNFHKIHNHLKSFIRRF